MKTSQNTPRLRELAGDGSSSTVETDLPAAYLRVLYNLPGSLSVESLPDIFRHVDAKPRLRQRRIWINGIDSAWRE